MDGEFLFLVLPLAVLGFVIAFPIIVFIRLATLAREIRELRISLYGADIRGPLPARPQIPRTAQPDFDLGRPSAPVAPAQPIPPPLVAVPRPSPVPQPAAPAEPPRERRPLPTLVTYHAPAAVAPAAPAVPRRKPVDLESMVGANWLAKLGVAAIVLAAAFFLQYAFANDLIGQSARVAIGLVGAAVMVGGGEYLIVKERYRNWAQVVISGGIMVYFLSIYAGYNLYHLAAFSYTTAFVAFAAGAVAASVLAVVSNSPSVAVLAVLGAFLAPVLIREGAGTEMGNLWRLYTYLAVINVWVLAVMRMRPWHALAGVSFLCTWSIFFLAGHFHGQGWLVEGFAGLFLLFALVSGVSLMRQTVEQARVAEEKGIDLTQGGVALILGGCIAFAVASAVALAGLGMLGVPDLMLSGALAALVLAGLSAALPPLPQNDAQVRQAFGYLAAAMLSVVLLGSLTSAGATPTKQVPLAFGFAVVNYLLFLGTATLLRRKPEGDAPAAVLVGANTVIHTSMALHVLARTEMWGFSAAALWLPVAALAMLGWMAATCRGDAANPLYRSAMIGSALALPLLALLGGLGQEPVRSQMALYVFGGEFLVLSAAWLALRGVVAKAPFKADLIVAFVNAAAFFGLFTRAVGATHVPGVVSTLAVATIGMAAYHALVGRSSLFEKREDALVRLGYLGIALTFVTIAIPLQLEASYITVAWAVEAAALIWTADAIRERRALWYGLALMGLAACKALLIDLMVRPPYAMLFLNTRMLAGAAVIVAAAFGASVLTQRRTRDEVETKVSNGLIALANAFLLIWVSVDLWDYVGQVWSAATRGQAQQLTLSLFWTVYALAVVSFGIGLRVRPVRLFGMGLLYLCIVKVFLLDLAGLQQPYRILSFLTLGVILLLVSLLYTRFEQRMTEERAALEPPAPGDEVHEIRQRRAS